MGRRLFACLALLPVVVLVGCSGGDGDAAAASRPNAAAGTETQAPPVSLPPTTAATPTRQPWDEPPWFRDKRLRTLYTKTKVGSCIYYRKKDYTVYDPFAYLMLVACDSTLARYKVVKRYEKFQTCSAGQLRYTLDHPKMSHKTVLTLCLREL